MKKILVLIVAIAILATAFAAYSLTTTAGAVSANLLSADASTFEGSTTGSWAAFNSGTIALSTAQHHSGSKSLAMTGRVTPKNYASPAYNIFNILKANGAGYYELSFWVYADGLTADASGAIILRGTEAYSFVGAAGANKNLAYATVKDKTWTYFHAFINVTAADVTGPLSAASGTVNLCTDMITAPADIYLDDASILYYGESAAQPTSVPTATPIPTSTLTTNFEDGTVQGWTSGGLGSQTLTVDSAVFHGGSKSLKATGRTQQYSGPALDLSSILANGVGWYKFTAYAKLVSGTEVGTTQLRMLLRNKTNVGDYNNDTSALNSNTFAGTTDWVKFEFTYNYTVDTLKYNLLCFDSLLCDFYIDDVTVSYSTTAPTTAAPTASPTATPTLAPGATAAPTPTPTAVPARTVGPDGNIFFAGDMEGTGALTGWEKVVSTVTLSLDTAVKHGGNQSLKQTASDKTYASPKYNIYDMIKANGPGNYTIKMWVYLDGLTADKDVQMVIRGESAADANSFIKLAADNVNYYVYLGTTKVPNKTWTLMTQSLTVTSTDISRAAGLGKFNLCLDSITAGATLYIDDVQVIDPSKVAKTAVAYKFTAPTGYAAATDWIRLTPFGADVLANNKATVLVKNTGNSAVDLYVSVRKDDSTWTTVAKSDTVTLNPGAYKTLTVANLPSDEGKAFIPLLEIKGLKAGDSLVIGGVYATNLSTFATGNAKNAALTVAQIDPTGVFPKDVEKTGDPAMLGYAMAAISGLGALVVGKKRFKR